MIRVKCAVNKTEKRRISKLKKLKFKITQLSGASVVIERRLSEGRS